MKLNIGGIDIFNNQKFLTRGVSEEIPVSLQLLMWEMIRTLPADKDYLQVFSLSEYNGKQRIVHTQEVPEYKKEYVFDFDTKVTGKVFVIDDSTHSTMLLANEY